MMHQILKCFSPLPNPPTPGIFKWDALDRSNAGVAVSVFGIGMQMEEASVKFYEEAARKTENTEAKKLFFITRSVGTSSF